MQKLSFVMFTLCKEFSKQNISDLRLFPKRNFTWEFSPIFLLSNDTKELLVSSIEQISKVYVPTCNFYENLSLDSNFT